MVQPIINQSESFYISSNTGGVKKNEQKGIRLNVMDKRMFWDVKPKPLEVTYEVVQLLTEQFLKKDIFLPLVEEKQLNNEFTVELMKQYTFFLNKMYESQFK